MSRRRTHHRRRLPAAPTCRQLGFRAGDRLVSDEWRAPKVLRSFDEVSVVLGTAEGSAIVATFPPDIRRQEAH